MDIEKLKDAAMAAKSADFTDHCAVGNYLVQVNVHNTLELIERLEAAEKDAARYRWLRQQESWIPNRSELPAPFCGAVKWVGSAYSENEIDDLIDYAIASVKEQK